MLIKCFSIFLSIFACVLSSSINQTRSKRDSEVCGFPSQVTSLIIGGDNFQRGTWPWMVAMMERTVSPPKFFCGGVLVTKTKVLTGNYQHRTSSSNSKHFRFFFQPLIASKTKNSGLECELAISCSCSALTI